MHSSTKKGPTRAVARSASRSKRRKQLKTVCDSRRSICACLGRSFKRQRLLTASYFSSFLQQQRRISRAAMDWDEEDELL